MIRKYLLIFIPLIAIVFLLAFHFRNSLSSKISDKSLPRYQITAYSLFRDETNRDSYHLRSWLFAIFDKKGFCKIVKWNGKLEYEQIRLSRKNIKLLNDYFIYAKSNQIDLGVPSAYDGPNIRLDFLNYKELKSLTFRENGDSIYHRIFNELGFWTHNKIHHTFSDTTEIKNLRIKMLESIRDDIEFEFKRNSIQYLIIEN